MIGLTRSTEISQKVLRDQFEEMLRLAYVSLTRARYLCCVTWLPPKTEKTKRLSPLDWLLFGDGPGETLAELKKELSAAAWAAGGGDDDGDARSSQHELLTAGFPEPNAHSKDEPQELDELVAAEWTQERAPDGWWRWSSFSSMVDPDRDEAYSGADEYVEDESEPAAAQSAMRVPAQDAGEPANLAGVRGGTQLGNLLHKLLEITDFTNTENLPAQIDDQLDRHGLRTNADNGNSEDADPELTPENLLETLEAVLDTNIPLGNESFCLRDLNASECIDEMDFAFPLAGGLESTREDQVTTAGIAAVLAAHARDTLPADYATRLDAMKHSLPMRGFLNGAIDLVFRRDGRYYVADYKSNNLGEQLGHYTPDRLVTAMSESHYHLQAQLYVLALHRMLKARMKDYDPGQHLGGCFYFFLRGMKPEKSAPYGIYFDKTPVEAVLALERAMCGEES